MSDHKMSENVVKLCRQSYQYCIVPIDIAVSTRFCILNVEQRMLPSVCGLAIQLINKEVSECSLPHTLVWLCDGKFFFSFICTLSEWNSAGLSAASSVYPSSIFLFCFKWFCSLFLIRCGTGDYQCPLG